MNEIYFNNDSSSDNSSDISIDCDNNSNTKDDFSNISMISDSQWISIINLPFKTKFKICIPDTNIYIAGNNVVDSLRKYKYWSWKESYIIYLSSKLTNTFTFVDVGAQIGYFTFLAHYLGATNIISIEPNKEHDKYFNATNNQYSTSKIKRYNYLISEKEEILFDGWTAHPDSVHKSDAEIYKCTTLDNICKNGCFFLKIDVEGLEPDVIKSAKIGIEKKLYPNILLEMMLPNKQYIEMLEFLDSNNYYFFYIDDSYGNNINTLGQWFDITHFKNWKTTKIGFNILATLNKSMYPF